MTTPTSTPWPLQLRLRVSIPTHPPLSIATDIELPTQHTNTETDLLVHFESLPEFPARTPHGNFRIQKISQVVYDRGNYERFDEDEAPGNSRNSGVLRALDAAWVGRSRAVVYVTAVPVEGVIWSRRVPLPKVGAEGEAGSAGLGGEDGGNRVPWNRRLS